MFSTLVRRAVPRGGALASASASAFGAARGVHAPWSSSAVASTRSSWFAGAETVATRAGARPSAPFAASSMWAAAGAARQAEVVRTSFGAARVRAFGVGAAASARAGTLSVAGARRAATDVATTLSRERPTSVAAGPARTAMMTARRAYYNNSGGVASGRLRYGAPPPASPRFDGEQMLWSVIGANTFIFALWHAVDPRFMQANFTVSERSVYSGSVHTLVTAAFSHYDFAHYASNMLALYYFGRTVGATFGGTFLLNLYLAGGVVASATHVLWCRHERRKRARRFRGGGGGFVPAGHRRSSEPPAAGWERRAGGAHAACAHRGGGVHPRARGRGGARLGGFRRRDLGRNRAGGADDAGVRARAGEFRCGAGAAASAFFGCRDRILPGGSERFRVGAAESRFGRRLGARNRRTAARGRFGLASARSVARAEAEDIERGRTPEAGLA